MIPVRENSEVVTIYSDHMRGFLQQGIPETIGFNTKWSNLDALGVSLSIYYISWKIEVLKEKNTSINGACSMAMLNNQRVYIYIMILWLRGSTASTAPGPHQRQDHDDRGIPVANDGQTHHQAGILSVENQQKPRVST